MPDVAVERGRHAVAEADVDDVVGRRDLADEGRGAEVVAGGVREAVAGGAQPGLRVDVAALRLGARDAGRVDCHVVVAVAQAGEGVGAAGVGELSRFGLPAAVERARLV